MHRVANTLFLRGALCSSVLSASHERVGSHTGSAYWAVTAESPRLLQYETVRTLGWSQNGQAGRLSLAPACHSAAHLGPLKALGPADAGQDEVAAAAVARAPPLGGLAFEGFLGHTLADLEAGALDRAARASDWEALPRQAGAGSRLQAI